MKLIRMSSLVTCLLFANKNVHSIEPLLFCERVIISIEIVPMLIELKVNSSAFISIFCDNARKTLSQKNGADFIIGLIC